MKSALKEYLSLEVFFLGGASLITCAAFWLFSAKTASLFVVSQVAFGLAFAFNHPHFLSSYMLLYGDFRKNIMQSARYLWAAVIAPFVLGAGLIYCFATGNVTWIGHSLNLMFFLVGWHYVKQVFGCVIVTSARRKLYYSKWERRAILANLFCIWMVSFLQGQAGGTFFTFYGINYAALGIGRGLIPWALGFTGATFAAVIYLHIRKGVRPSPPAAAALASLYVWYLPVFAHPGFAYFIPLFHSMQYLTFVWSFKTNQVGDYLRTLKTDSEKRKIWMRDLLGYAAMAAMLGAMAFEFVPKFLDSRQILQNPALGTSPFVAAFLIFINVHHYFIDNVIWRSTNDQVKKYLFAPARVEDKTLSNKSAGKSDSRFAS